MKTGTTFTLFLTAILTLAAGSVFGAYSGGTGDPCTPYQIATKADLLALAANTADYNKCFILTADINMGGQVFTTAIIAPDTVAGNYSFEGTAFTGTFDGNGHKITNFTINGGHNCHLGLFGYISSGGSVKNLGLENFTVSGSSNSQYVAGLVGLSSGSISNCYSTGAVSGGSNSFSVGGLVGGNSGGISDCYSTGAVSGYADFGGLVGYNYSNSSINDCYSTGDVNGGDSSYDIGGLVGGNNGSISTCYSTGDINGGDSSYDIGGLVGGNSSSGSISTCYSTGAVSGVSNSYYVGCLVGYNSGGISNCYSTGTVSGSEDVGGLVGGNYGTISSCYSTGAVGGSTKVGGLVGWTGGSVSNCYSTGTVNGSAIVGGLLGENYKGKIIRCYSTGRPAGSSNVGGLCGYKVTGGDYEDTGNFWDIQTSGCAISAGGTGKTTAEMKMLSTFTSAGWDFVNLWGIGNGQTYPYLKPLTGVNPADLNYSGKVDFDDFAIFADNWLTQW